ncbi:MAG: UDP-N-acetylmuramoyl-tripeptide--D-alanyl-D-alanine ligase [Bacteroidota bacterium]
MPYSTDTRTLQPGDTYVAIRGETHDGHRFIPQALDKGATGIVTEVDVDVPEGVRLTRVDDSVAHLVAEASAKLRRVGPEVVAITGSVGKTTTRTAIEAVLREGFSVTASEGNKNTPLGLSLMLLNRDFDADGVLVLEMGVRLPGDIAELCAAFPPTVSVVTAVKAVHVETLGSIDGVQREKSEIVRALPASGTAVLNADDPRVRAMADVTAASVRTFGLGPEADLRPDRITADLPILGAHAVPTALSAFAVAEALGMDDAAINRGLAVIVPETGRLNKLPGRAGSTLIDDTYNASPDATVAALGVLRALPGTRRVACLGDMLELGDTEVAQHADTLRAALDHADVVHAVGPIMAEAVGSLGPRGKRITTWAASEDLAEAVRSGAAGVPEAGDVVLVKGSQGTRMERVSGAVLHPDIEAADVLPRQTEAWKAIR